MSATTTDERIFGTTADGTVEFLSYRPQHLAGVKNVIDTYFYAGECLANGIGLNLPAERAARDEMTAFCVQTLPEGLSIVARDAKTKQICGHVVNQLQLEDRSGGPSVFERFMNGEQCRTPLGKEYFRVMIELGGQADLFAIRRCSVLMGIMFLGVAPEYARRGVGLKLVEFSLQLARELKAGREESLELLPTAELRVAARRLGGATAQYASLYSKSIGLKLGFVVHGELRYDEMEYGGKRLQERIPNALQRSIQMMSVAV